MFKTKIPNSIFIFLIIFYSAFLIAFSIVHWFPEYTKYLVKEHSYLENIGAGLFLLSALTALFATFIAKTKKYLPATFSFFGFILFLDEISWGKDLFWKNPPIFLGVGVDSSHDFVDAFVKTALEKDLLYLLLIFGFILFSIAIIFLIRKKDFLQKIFFSKEQKFFLVLIFLFLFIAKILDLHLFKIHGIALVNFTAMEEFLEFGAALSILFLYIKLLPSWIKKV